MLMLTWRHSDPTSSLLADSQSLNSATLLLHTLIPFFPITVFWWKRAGATTISSLLMGFGFGSESFCRVEICCSWVRWDSSDWI
uniref:Putative ovule protein n=1 Tax=Solanum chacoense TaxID=4108 RepID=A0A0V0HE53_SOLCH